MRASKPRSGFLGFLAVSAGALLFFSSFSFLSSMGLVACSSSQPAAVIVGIDAQAPQAVGATCNPASPEPCLPSGDVCTGVTCDPTLLVCTQFDTDAGGPCTADVAPCTTTADCDLGLTCGFPVDGGCGAQGACINPPIPCEEDASSCGTTPPVCGCDGLPDPVLTLGYAASPVASTIACPDGGPVFDAGPGDAQGDSEGPSDASDASDSASD